MLSGKDYVDDCETMFNSLIDHWYARDPEEEAESYEDARELWKSKFREPFELDLSRPSIDWDRQPKRPYNSQIKYDIAEAVQRQKHYYYQVSLPHYQDKEFLNSAVDRYKSQIELLELSPSTGNLTPMDVSLIWRSHMLNPVLYEEDMKKIFETVPELSDDYFYQRQNETNVSMEQESRKLWKQKFGEDYAIRGAGFRGIAPNSTLSIEDYERQLEVRTNHYDATITRMSIRGVNGLKNIQLKFELIPRNRSLPSMQLFKKNAKISSSQNSHDWNNTSREGLHRFMYDTEQYEKVRIELYDHGVFKKSELLAECETNLFDKVKLSPMRGQTLSKDALLFSVHNGQPLCEVSLTIFTNPGSPGVAMLQVTPDEFGDREKSKASAWGPIPLPKNPSGPDAYTGACSYAVHEICNQQDEGVYNVRVIHSIEAFMSVIQVLDNEEKFQALAHIIGSNQLPLPDQLNNPEQAITLDPVAGERGILVKDALGDFAVVIAKWILKNPQNNRGPKRPLQPNRENPGFLDINIHHLRKVNRVKIPLPTRLPNGEFDFNLKIDGVNIDVKNGNINISEKTRELAANVALGFACSLLFILCRPKSNIESIRGTEDDARYGNRYERSNSYDPYDDRRQDGHYSDYRQDRQSRKGRSQRNLEITEKDLMLVVASGLKAEQLPFKINRDGGLQPGYGAGVTGFIPLNKYAMQGVRAQSADPLDTRNRMNGLVDIGGQLGANFAGNLAVNGMENAANFGGKFAKAGMNQIDQGNFGMDGIDGIENAGKWKKGFSKISSFFKSTKPNFDNLGSGFDNMKVPEMNGLDNIDMTGAGKLAGKMGKFGMNQMMNDDNDEGFNVKGAAKLGAKLGKFGMKQMMNDDEDDGGFNVKGAAKLGGKLGKFGMKQMMNEDGEGFNVKGAAKLGAKLGKFGMKQMMNDEGGDDEDGGFNVKSAAKLGAKLGKFGMKQMMNDEDDDDEDGGFNVKGAAKLGAKLGRFGMKQMMNDEDDEDDEDEDFAVENAAKLAGEFSKFGKKLMSKKNKENFNDFGTGMGTNLTNFGTSQLNRGKLGGNFDMQRGGDMMNKKKGFFSKIFKSKPELPNQFADAGKFGGNINAQGKFGNGFGGMDRFGSQMSDMSRGGEQGFNRIESRRMNNDEEFDVPEDFDINANYTKKRPDRNDYRKNDFEDDEPDYDLSRNNSRNQPNRQDASHIAQRSAEAYLANKRSGKGQEDFGDFDSDHMSQALEDVPGADILARVKNGPKKNHSSLERNTRDGRFSKDRNQFGGQHYDNGGFNNGRKQNKKNKKQSSSEDDSYDRVTGDANGYGMAKYNGMRAAPSNYNPYGGGTGVRDNGQRSNGNQRKVQARNGNRGYGNEYDQYGY